MSRFQTPDALSFVTYGDADQLAGHVGYPLPLGCDNLILIRHKEITENTDATSSVTNSIAGPARNNGAKKKAIKKTALLPSLQGSGSGLTCWSTGAKAPSQLKTRNKNHIQNDRTRSLLFPIKSFTISRKKSRSNF